MSYLHCPACSRAYNLATQPSCPYCPAVAARVEPPVAAPVDPIEDIVAAAAALARALASATAAERAAAAARIEPLGAPVADAPPSIRTALAPAPPRTPPRRRHLLTTLAFAVLDRIAPHAPGSPGAPNRLLRAVHARVKALAA